LKFRYCPKCVSLDIMDSANGAACAKCGYSGSMNSDSMDVINAARRSARSRASHSDSEVLTGGNAKAPEGFAEKQKALKERMKKLGSTSDFEVM